MRVAFGGLVLTTLAIAGFYAGILNDAPPAAAAPVNDNLADAIEVFVPFPGGVVHVGTNLDATLEAGEPNALSGCAPGDPAPGIARSVWYRWQSPGAPGTIVLDTHGSLPDTVLGVFTGTSHPLTQVVCNDYLVGPNFGPSAVALTYAASTTYYIQVSSYVFGGAGPVHLSMTHGAGLYPGGLVDNNVSDGALSLREAMLLASGGAAALGRAVSASEQAYIVNSAEMGSSGFDLVRLSPGGTINLVSPLPTMDQSLDHVSGLGGAVVDGQDVVARCFDVSGGGNKLTGFNIVDCAEGVRLTGFGNQVGGTAGAVERNVIGSGVTGVLINGESADINLLVNNYIGTDASGDLPNANSAYGVTITNGADDNTIGLAQPNPPNVFSGNTMGGVLISASGTTGNVVANSRIGLGASGFAVPNSIGVTVAAGATGNTVGPRFAGEPGTRNVISGNTLHGVSLEGSGTSNNQVRGNYIGLDVVGTAAIGNDTGVFIDNFVTGNTIGGDTPGDANHISGNQAHGVNIEGFGADGNMVRGNIIGLGATGLDVGNGAPGGAFGAGVVVRSVGNIIGGGLPGQGNVISGNEQGIYIVGGTDNVVQGNFVGTNVAGTAAIPNDTSAVIFSSGATGNLIGGDSPSERNVLSGNTFYGVDFVDSASNNVISGNYIGTNAAGTAAIPNYHGIFNFAGPNQIGGELPGEGNLISGNTNHGIVFASASTSGGKVLGNRIGTTKTGLGALGNGFTGISISTDSSSIEVGNTTGGGNIIAFNAASGVAVAGATSVGVTIRGNSIHSNGNLGIQLQASANDGVSAPAITSASAVHASGTACPGCTVDVYSDTSDEGRHYLGSTQATLGGTFSVASAQSPPAAFLTATATQNGSTSQFSATYAAELCNGIDDDLDVMVDEGHPNADGDIRKDCVDSGQTVFYPAGHALSATTVDCVFIAEDVDAFKDGDGCPEPDNDNDAFPDTTDACPGTNSQTGADGALGAPQDTNLNGVQDGAEAAFTTDDVMPLLAWEDKDGVLDTDGCHDSPGDDFDGDGFTDDAEVLTHLTDAGNPDTDVDTVIDGTDNCPLWPNTAQNLPPWTVPANDTDCDGFNKTREQHVGTDPTKHCNDNSGLNNEPDYWPTDFNDSRSTNLSDVVLIGPSYNKSMNQDGYNQRFDLNVSNSVNLSDVVLIGPFYNKSCA